eukprot:sb/3478717/
MIVCVNPSTECFDESIHALKFSALATRLCFGRRTKHICKGGLEHNKQKCRIREEVTEEVQERFREMRKNHREEIERVSRCSRCSIFSLPGWMPEGHPPG